MDPEIANSPNGYVVRFRKRENKDYCAEVNMGYREDAKRLLPKTLVVHGRESCLVALKQLKVISAWMMYNNHSM